MDELEEEFEHYMKINKDFKSIILESFNGVFIRSQGSSGQDFHADIAKENKYFEKTNYFHSGENSFFHLTSIANLLSILNSRIFRLYNLHSSNDPEEYNYAAEALQLSENEIEHRKKYLYTFSFCPLSELNNKKVWEVYGNDFTGAAMVFEIENNPKDWVNYHMSEVKYEVVKNFENHFSKVKELEKKYSITAHCDLSKLMAFHKMAKWKEEKEIRIMTYYPFDHYEECLKYSKSEFRLEPDRNRIVNYIDLPIWVNNDSGSVKSNMSPELDRTQNLSSDYFDSRPKIKITKIYFGSNCGIETNSLLRFRSELMDIVRFNYGYEIEMDINLFGL